MTEEVVQTVAGIFTEKVLTNRPSKLPNRFSSTTLLYNSEIWTLNSDTFISPFIDVHKVFCGNEILPIHIIQFDWTKYTPRHNSGNSYLKQQFEQWLKGGKYSWVAALFCKEVYKDRAFYPLYSVAVPDVHVYHKVKNALVETYIDWTFTKKLPVIGW